jgi:hypothetical protein
MADRELAIRQAEVPMELSVPDLMAQVRKIQEVMKQAMHENEHYGVIPGTGKKPTLLKPGAEKLCLLFRLDPQFESVEVRDGEHLTVKSRCVLYHIPTSLRMGSGEGSCSTKETKYAFRNATLACPECGKDAIIKGKEEYGGGWLCFKKKGGCGAKFPDDQFKTTDMEKVAVDNLADEYNTVLKMANKRALVAAVLVTTAASDIFTQDVEEMPQFEQKRAEPSPTPEPAPNVAPGARQTAKTALGHAILEYCNQDKTGASEVLQAVSGKSTLRDLTEQQAGVAMDKFRRDYLDNIPTDDNIPEFHAPRDVGEDG